MTVTWTDAARRELDAALGRLGRTLAGTEADAEEVVADLRRHVEEEAAARGLPVVTEEDVRAILAGLGAGGAGQDLLPSPTSTASAPAAKSRGRVPMLAAIFLWPFGVILPLVALILEWPSISAGGLFDPLPTKAHVILVATAAGEFRGALALRIIARSALAAAREWSALGSRSTPPWSSRRRRISVLAIMAYGLAPVAPLFAVICSLACAPLRACGDPG